MNFFLFDVKIKEISPFTCNSTRIATLIYTF